MAWPEVTFRDWDHFLRMVSSLTVGSPFETAYLFRGQSDAGWQLEPSLLRYLSTDATPEEALTIERHSMRDFGSQAQLNVGTGFVPSGPATLPWLSLMQHYGCPTRLLDWTKSPFVAAYFAVEQGWDYDGAIWLFHVADMRAQMSKDFADVYLKVEPEFSRYLSDPEPDPSLQPWFPNTLTERMVAQQGAFTFSPFILGKPDKIIDDALSPLCPREDGSEVYRKVVVLRELKPTFLRMLRTMNVTAASLFPGADGLGRSVSESVKLTAHT